MDREVGVSSTELPVTSGQGARGPSLGEVQGQTETAPGCWKSPGGPQKRLHRMRDQAHSWLAEDFPAGKPQAMWPPGQEVSNWLPNLLAAASGPRTELGGLARLTVRLKLLPPAWGDRCSGPIPSQGSRRWTDRGGGWTDRPLDHTFTPPAPLHLTSEGLPFTHFLFTIHLINLYQGLCYFLSARHHLS